MSERYETGCLNSITTSFENSILGIGNFMPELHVAQQSRREKLRVQQSSTPSHHVEDFPIHSEQLPIDPGLNPDPIQNRHFRNCDVLYDTTMLSSEMLNFSTNSYVLSAAHKDVSVHQDSGAGRLGRLVDTEHVSFGHLSRAIPSNFKLSAKASETQNCVYWKGPGSHHGSELIVKYVGGSESSACNQEIIPGAVKDNGIDASNLFLKPACSGYQDVQSSLTNPSSEISSSQEGQKHYGEMRFGSPIYRNTLEDVVTTSTVGSQGFELGSLVHQNIRETGSLANGGELALLPTYVNASRLINAATWMNRSVESSHQWSGELGFAANKSDGDLRCLTSDSRTQGLSLSLSSHPSSEIHSAQFGERFGSENLQSGTGVSTDPLPLDSKTDNKSDYLSANSKSSLGNKTFDNSVRGILGSSTYTHRSSGPLGPFTGYATILNSSKFLKPTQQLLDEICNAVGQKFVKSYEGSERSYGDVTISGDTANVGSEGGEKGGVSGVSSIFYSSNKANSEAGVTATDKAAIGNAYCDSYRPECQQRKTKLIYMQEEICRRTKQYHQQMQMVVTSFKSVAGLSAATPYTSFAIKTVLRHFRCLKNAISDQLQHISKTLGEDMSSLATGKGAATAKLKFIDESLRNRKSGGGSLGYLESQQHIWRPQRGLPERSVAILRAWLFEHFLHPYPTDNDKHMLATQTGLSRNQVSNWFINARVRVWKPMVEEIHMLETKGLAETDSNSGKNDRKHTTDGGGSSRSNIDQHTDAMSQKRVGGCSIMEPMPNAETGQKAERLNQGKRSRMDIQIPASVEDGSLMGLVPYHRSGLEIGELGAVSLTLGLRQGEESVQQQQMQQQDHHHHQLMQQFGGHHHQMIHDFVG